VADSAGHLVWIDCEMTGLDIVKDKLIEVAVVVTDSELNVLDPGLDLIISADDADLDGMNEVVDEMHRKSGLTDEVREYVLAQDVAGRFLDMIKEFLDFAVPAYIAEGKSRLTVALGCTGGFHRSIVMAEELATWLRERDYGPVAVFHRELERT